MRMCCICGKRDDYTNGPFFSIPKDEKKRKKWCQVLGIMLKDFQFICGDHFSPSDIVKRSKMRVLLPNAVPFAASDKNRTPSQNFDHTINERYKNVVKQESIDTDQEFVTTLPTANVVPTTTEVPVKTEPIFDDQLSSITVKNEPITDDDPLDKTTSPFTISNVSTLNDFDNPPVNGFVIYELETKSYGKNNNIIGNARVNNPGNEQIPLSSTPRLACTAAVSAPSAPVVLGELPATKSPSPPILLNGQLRKRAKVIVATPSVNATNVANKKICYNLQSSEAQTKVQPANARDTPHTATKNILNYQLQKKGPFMPEINGENVRKKPSLKVRTTAECPQKMVEKTNAVSPTVEQNVTLASDTTKSVKVAEIVVKTEIPQIKSEPNVVTTNKDQVATAPMSIPNVIKINSPNYAPLTSASSVQTETTPIPAPIGELKVKCLCRLSQSNFDTGSQSVTDADLIDFFKDMFEKTRRLTKPQQRAVKISLLQAVCESEDMAEKGKCCCF